MSHVAQSVSKQCRVQMLLQGGRPDHSTSPDLWRRSKNLVVISMKHILLGAPTKISLGLVRPLPGVALALGWGTLRGASKVQVTQGLGLEATEPRLTHATQAESGC